METFVQLAGQFKGLTWLKMFDVLTLLTALALIHFLVTVLICLAWRLVPSMPGVKYWATGRILTTLALVLLALKDQISFDIAVMSSQAVFFIGQYYVWQGSVLYKDQPRTSPAPVILAFCIIMAMVIWGLMTLHAEIRWLASSLVVICFSWLNASALWKGSRRNQFVACRFVAFFLVVHGGVFVLRAAVAIALLAGISFFPQEWLQQFTFFEAIVMSVLIGMGYIVLITERLQSELRKQADHDPLTGAYNRRAFYEKTEQLLQTTGEVSVSCIVIDLDHFKTLNDQYGHQAGDAALIHFVQIAEQVLNEQCDDWLLSRFGGEEFTILLPALSGDESRSVADNIRQRLEQSRVHYDGQDISMTVSSGIAEGYIKDNQLDTDRLFRQADQALYLAKSAGRNRVVQYQSDKAPAMESLPA